LGSPNTTFEPLLINATSTNASIVANAGVECNLDDIRITNVGRYSSGFTPPTGAYPDS
jgi:hypothetical protein